MSEEANGLEEQAKKRQERIKSLKRRREERNDNENNTDTQDGGKMALPKPKFRSYKPQDKTLSDYARKKTDIVNVENEVEDLLSLAKSEVVIDQLDIASLAPRRPDWDLKRDVEKKLEKLARRTRKAMAELIREKLKEKQDLAEVSNAPVDV